MLLAGHERGWLRTSNHPTDARIHHILLLSSNGDVSVSGGPDMYKHAISQPGLLRGGGKGGVNLNSAASIRVSERAVAIGVSDAFCRKIFRNNRGIFERHKFRPVPVADA